MKMKKIKDERLILQNLKNIRIAYIIQTAGILGILGYEIVTKGFDGMRENPLWLLFMITTIISAYLSISISADHESNEKSPKKSLIISLFVLVIISTIIGFFVSITDGFTLLDGIIMGGILFICGLVPVFYIYYLRTKRQNGNFDE
jgi:cell division protein FtsW (lipid II flippase)